MFLRENAQQVQTKLKVMQTIIAARTILTNSEGPCTLGVGKFTPIRPCPVAMVAPDTDGLWRFGGD